MEKFKVTIKTAKTENVCKVTAKNIRKTFNKRLAGIVLDKDFEYLEIRTKEPSIAIVEKMI